MYGPVAFSADGRMFATSSLRPNKEILLYETATGNHVRPNWRSTCGRVWSLAFFPDGRRLASGLGDGNVVIWDLSSPEHSVNEP